MAHKQELELRQQELELRLADLKDKKVKEEGELNPVQLYIDDLILTIGYVEQQLQRI